MKRFECTIPVGEDFSDECDEDNQPAVEKVFCAFLKEPASWKERPQVPLLATPRPYPAAQRPYLTTSGAHSPTQTTFLSVPRIYLATPRPYPAAPRAYLTAPRACSCSKTLFFISKCLFC